MKLPWVTASVSLSVPCLCDSCGHHYAGGYRPQYHLDGDGAENNCCACVSWCTGEPDARIETRISPSSARSHWETTAPEAQASTGGAHSRLFGEAPIVSCETARYEYRLLPECLLLSEHGLLCISAGPAPGAYAIFVLVVRRGNSPLAAAQALV